MKIGRNDLCPCGSGRKFKKCHLNMPRLQMATPLEQEVPAMPAHIHQRIERHRLEEQARVATFGEIRPIIHTPNYKGYRFVAVRGRVYYSKKWRFFLDFLLEYGMMRFGQEWLEAQNNATVADQHPLYRWRKQAYAYMRLQKPLPNGVFAALPNGPLAACNNFYYDLYTVDDNSHLNEDLLDRLRNRDQFQGALHELFAEATCLRAGFTIIRENEKDPNRRHVEFMAVHKSTGQHVLVEAKSRHRPGVMGREGTKDPSPDYRFRRLINDAVTKDPNNPLALFVDTNLPVERAERFYATPSLNPPVPSPVMAAIIDRVRIDHGDVDPYNLLVFSNHPQHYFEDDRIAPGNRFSAFLCNKPRVPVVHQQALSDLVAAANLYGNVPTHFPPAPGDGIN